MKKQGLIAGFALAAAMALAPYGISAAPGTGSAIADNKMPDGTVYAGVSPETDKPLYTTPADAPGLYTFSDGANYCRALQASRHQDWHVPTKDELNVLFQSRAAIGGFNETGQKPDGWYWSSMSALYGNRFKAYDERFSDGSGGVSDKESVSSLRCVR